MQYQTIYQLDKISFAYPQSENTLLENISVEIHRGESICILGANGVGKSTLLKILSGLVSPTAGNLYYLREELTSTKLKKGNFRRNFYGSLGFLFQNSDAQLFCNTVEEEIAFGPLQLNYHRAAVSHVVQEISSLLGIQDLLPCSPHILSGGQKKKVAIATMLSTNPEVFILDEPTNNLDPRSQKKILDIFKALLSNDKTIIFTTHHLHHIESLASRVILLDENGILADGSPNEILNDHELLLRANVI